MRKLILNLITIFFIILFGYIIIYSMFFGEEVLFEFNKIILFIGVILYIIVCVLFYKYIIPKLIKYKKLPIILFLIFMILTIFISYDLRVNRSWDMGRVIDIAENIVSKGYTKDVYLYQYQSNIFITYMYVIVINIIKLCSIQIITGVTLFNNFFIIGTVICIYYATKTLYGEKQALMLLIICLFTTPLYMYGAIYYSDSPAMFVTSLCLLLFLKISKNSKYNIILQILFGLAIVLSLIIKVISFFLIIAIIIYALLKKELFKNIKKYKIAIFSFILIFSLYNIFIYEFVVNDKNKLDEYKIPVEYWIATGLIDNGGYNRNINILITKTKYYEEKKIVGKKFISDTLSNYKFITLIKHINDKIKYAWGDGTYYASEKVNRNPYKKGILYEYVARDGLKTKYYKYYPQIMHFGMLIFIIIYVINAFIKQKYNKDTPLYISIFGLIVFLLIMENRSRYLLPLLPIMLILETSGIVTLSNVKINKSA